MAPAKKKKVKGDAASEQTTAHHLPSANQSAAISIFTSALSVLRVSFRCNFTATTSVSAANTIVTLKSVLRRPESFQLG